MKAISSKTDTTKVRLDASVDMDDLFDGRTWELTKGDDFGCSASSAATLVRNAFRERYGLVRITEDKATNSIRVTAIPGTHWRK